jgi:Stress responsive A/B Barrel Domain
MFYRASAAVHSALRAALLPACACCLAGLDDPKGCYGQSAAKQEAPPGAKSETKVEVLRHAVFFEFKASSAPEDVDQVVEAFRALPSKIKEIREFQSGQNISRSELNDGLTHCFLLTFKDEAGRAAYLPHPAHKAFGAVLRPHLDHVFVVDYWGRARAIRFDKELKHAVFFKFKDNTSDVEVRAVENGLAGLPSKIDAIKAFEWGTNNSPETHDESFTHCFLFTFDSEAGLKEYASHPAHTAAANELKPKVEKIRVLDFWADDVLPSEIP